MRGAWAVLASAAVLAACSSGPVGPASSGSVTSGPPASTGRPAATAGVACPGSATPDQPGDPARARPALRDWYQLAAMDPTAPRVLAGETGFAEGTGQSSLLALWAFDVCTNAWAPLREASLPPGEGTSLQQLVTDPSAAVVRGVPLWQSPIWTLDPAAGSWTATQVAGGGSEAWSMAVFDTDAGRVLLFDPNAITAGDSSGVKALDLAAHLWTGLDAADPDADRPAAGMDAIDVAYDGAAHRLVLVLTPQGSDTSAAQTWRFDPDARAWSRGADVPRTLPGGYPSEGWAMAYDPVTSRTWAFADTAMLGYDARSDDWQVAERGAGWPAAEMLGGVAVDPTARIVSTMLADPVNGRLLVIGGHVRPAGAQPGGFVREGSLVAADDVWAYRPATNTWTMLLGPSDHPASYGPG